MSEKMDNLLLTGDSEGCCGGLAPTEADTCCVDDANAKASGDDGCGCDSASDESAKTGSCC